MLRIIGGKYRHLIIKAPDVSSTRPTTDKVREALMSALAFDLPDSVVLDLFAGSGALGLEALSRGAKKAYFGDNNKKAYFTIIENIKKLKVEEETKVFFGDYKQVLNKIKLTNEKLDIVFLDPPYIKKELYDEVVNYLFDNDMLSDNAIVIKEWNNTILEDERFSKHKAYHYGMINILVERR